MQVKHRETIMYLAARESDHLDRKTLRALAISVPAIYVFEACAAGDISPEKGSAILMLRREWLKADQPWFVRLAIWIGWLFFGGNDD